MLLPLAAIRAMGLVLYGPWLPRFLCCLWLSLLLLGVASSAAFGFCPCRLFLFYFEMLLLLGDAHDRQRNYVV